MLSLHGALLFLKLYCIIILFSAIFHLFNITVALKKMYSMKGSTVYVFDYTLFQFKC